MLKLHLQVVFTTSFILFFPTIALGSSIITNPTDEPICYMQTAEGRTVNLSSLCAKKAQTQAQQVVLTDVKYEQDSMSGKVVNNSNRIVANPSVNYEVLDHKGQVIERGSVPIQAANLSPGQSASFEAFTEGDTQVRATSVSWE